MIKLLVLGTTGMLGNAVMGYFRSASQFEVTGTSRNPAAQDEILFDALTQPLHTLPAHFDYAINCIGMIKPYVESNLLRAIKVNSVFPHELADYCDQHGMKLLHITTDCVYSGAAGQYVESAVHDPSDAYGKSKSLGECPGKAMVLRTSIVGPETNHFASLLSWAQSKKNQMIDGYVTHLWNGITTDQYAKVCEQIILKDLFEIGLFHIFASDDVNKSQLLHYFNEKYHLNLQITPAYPPTIDRTLRTEKSLCSRLNIPTVGQMIFEMEVPKR